MKILFISTHLNAGGITSYLYILSKGLIGLGNSISIATSGGDFEDEFVKLGVDVIKVNIKTKSELSPKIYFALISLRKYIIDNKIDIIHANARITQVMAVILSKTTKTPYVSTCHGFFKKKLSRMLFPCWGDNVIAISRQVEEHLVNDFRVNKNKICLVEHGVDLEKFKVVDEETKKRNRIKYGFSNEPLVGMVARLSEVKGQDFLILSLKEIIREILNVKLLLFGDGKTKGDLEELVLKNALEKYVCFYPIVNNSWECLSLLDVCVVPSRQEGLGLTVMEAQAVGLAVVAFKVGGIPSLIENGKTGILVEAENVNALAKEIIMLFKDKERMKNIGVEARKFVEEKHSSEDMVRNTLEVYKRFNGKR